ncbi:Uncharacterized protein DAT39_016110 [Clarias magur]|uniref:Uncharacterized protein n=1 Tax=Clarias magur TaxID=1594786 RepID=A0A8J4WWS7_CLAMG|nr:Uncharacterized protein DAT39_016110 [Clarias magur]
MLCQIIPRLAEEALPANREGACLQPAGNSISHNASFCSGVRGLREWSCNCSVEQLVTATYGLGSKASRCQCNQIGFSENGEACSSRIYF